MNQKLEDFTDEVEFWPDLFKIGKILNVRPVVYELGMDGDLTPEEIKSRAHVKAAEVRAEQIEMFTGSLDRAAMSLTFEQLKIYIAHYATYHSAAKAAKAADGSMACFRHRRKIDAVFAEMWQLARDHWTDVLEETGM